MGMPVTMCTGTSTIGKHAPRFGIFMKNIKFQCVFWPFLGHFWPFLRPQNRGLALYYPPRPPLPPVWQKTTLFPVFFCAPFPNFEGKIMDFWKKRGGNSNLKSLTTPIFVQGEVTTPFLPVHMCNISVLCISISLSMLKVKVKVFRLCQWQESFLAKIPWCFETDSFQSNW